MHAHAALNLDDWPHVFRPATEPGAPTLLLLHGTGGTERDFIGLADRVAPGAALLSPRGRVSEDGAARFFPRLAEGVFNREQVVPRIEELATFIRAAIGRHGLGDLFALGYSNGANAAAVLLQLHPDLPLRGAVLLRPMIVLDQAATPDSLSERRVLLLNGSDDPTVPGDHPPRLAALLRAGGALVEHRVHTGARHGPVPADIKAAREFFSARRNEG
jgi:predicted esterase